ncbi:GRF zinc finger protein [Medicago truncatula]|uniref:GRF zinc finger protein n=1 Tax=Medicago truncatula TaxID=3880 RepID=G7KP05_MEDTR|nr:GRF zinc finger protein [Medicago truncatula]
MVIVEDLVFRNDGWWAYGQKPATTVGLNLSSSSMCNDDVRELQCWCPRICVVRKVNIVNNLGRSFYACSMSKLLKIVFVTNTYDLIILVSLTGPIVDTVIMNPSFGTKKKSADLEFLSVAMNVASRSVDSLHKISTRDALLRVG